MITSNSVVLPLLQFCCCKILKHFVSYRDLKKAMLGFWFVLMLFLDRKGFFLQKVINEHIVIKLKFALHFHWKRTKMTKTNLGGHKKHF